MPFNIGAPELIIILIIALIVLGPGKLPDVASSLGRSLREFRKAATDVSDAGRLDTPPPAAPASASSAATPPAAPAVPNTITGAADPNTLQPAGPASDLDRSSPGSRDPRRPQASRMRSPARTQPMTAAAPADPAQLPSMPLTAHLAELRNRLIWSILAVLVGGSVGFAFGEQLIDLLKAPLPPDVTLQQIEIGDGFSIRLQIAFVVGIILAMPVLLWHVWRFIAPGLTQSERRSVLPWIPAALVFFALGVSIAWVVLPYAAQFLLSFVPPGVQRQINIKSYFDFISSLFLAFGILMEFPILLVGLSRVRIVTSERLRRSRRIVILAIAIFAAVATPGGDLVSPFVLGLTLYVLYEGTTLFIRRTGR